MIRNILAFELHSRAKKISTYIYFLIFFLLAYVGIFRASVSHGFLNRLIGAGSGNINANAPFAIHYLIMFLTNYGVIITAAFFGHAAYRDFKENTYVYNFSYPVKKFDYLVGKFLGAFLSVLFVFSGVGVGAYLGSLSPFTDMAKIGDVQLIAYIWPYLTGVLPNIFFTGAIFFTLSLLTRKFIPVYAGMVFIIVGYLVGVSLARSESYTVAALLDPFGGLAVREIYGFWNAAQKNVRLIPLSGSYLFNRLIWVSLGCMILIYAFKKFELSLITTLGKNYSRSIQKLSTPKSEMIDQPIIQQEIRYEFRFQNSMRQMLYTSWREFLGLIKNRYFLITLALGTILVFVLGFKNVGIVRGTQTFPVTSQLLDTTQNSLYLFSIVVILFAAGELIWRERRCNVQECYDALPVADWVPLFGKLGAIIIIQAVIMLIVMISGVSIQIIKGYYHFELGLYFKELFGLRLPYFILISIFAMFIQVIVNRKIIGYIITLVFVDDLFPALGFEHHLWRFASSPSYIYSDMNGYGPYLDALWSYNLFWIFLSIVLLVIASLLWVRGNDTQFLDRLKSSKSRITCSKSIIAGAGLLGCLVMGVFILYNTTVLNQFESSKYVERMQADYEKTFKKYDLVSGTRITDMRLQVDIFPNTRKARFDGKITLKNKTSVDIDEIFVQVPTGVDIGQLELTSGSVLKDSSREHGVYIYKLTEPLIPGGTTSLIFNLELAVRGFKNHDQMTRLIQNGTFLPTFLFLPAFCYNPYSMNELRDNDRRREYGLPPKERLPSIYDTRARMNTMVAHDADWINLETIVSTSKDQIAITSGKLINEWSEGDRRFFHYKTEQKILKYFSLISGKFEVRKDRWRDVNIELFYHPGHEYNLALMIDAVKKSLDYFSTNFSPYQFSDLRIVEFPRYEIFAEGFPGVIPISEGYGFIAKYDGKRVKEAFRVVAHEIGHQWWAHQVIGAEVQGEFLLSETMAQYSALVVTSQQYDQGLMNKYVKHEIDRYLRGRGRETEYEVPLVVTNQESWYLNYAKGFVVMNALRNYIGEENLNSAIKSYIHEVAFQDPPYTTALEFLKFIKDATPDSLKYVIRDMFETIVLYEVRGLEATYQRTGSGKYEVNFSYEANKLLTDSTGQEKSIAINDYITFGVFDASDNPLYLKKHWINSEKGKLTLLVDDVPFKVGIDPYYYLIDKNTEDNTIAVKLE